MFANRTVRWSLGAAALCLVLIAAAWFLLLSPRRADAAALRDQADASDQQAQLLQIKLAQLKSQAADLPQQKAKLKQIAAELSPDADIPEYVNVLQETTSASGTVLTSVAPGTPTLVTLSTAAAGTSATSGLGSPGDLVSIPMNIEVRGDFTELTQWLQQLQTKVSRSYLVNGFTVTPPEGGGGTTTDGLSGASIDDSGSFAAAATSTPTSTSKGQEGVTSTATATVAPGATATATGSTATATGGTGGTTDGTTTSSTEWTLNLTGMVFVLLTENSTLEKVQADAAAAQASLAGTWTEVTPSATATSSAGATTSSTATTTATTAPNSSGSGTN